MTDFLGDPAARRVKRRMLGLLALAELFGMSVWFSASAVEPALTDAWGLHESGRAWLTMSVQLGFVVGALLSAILNLPDRLSTWRLLAWSSFAAAAATAAIPLGGFALALPLRFAAGFFLAGVYPVGMKIVATWTREDRGLGIGLVVGALTLGKAAPHLLKAAGGLAYWPLVLYASGALAALGGLIGLLWVREGPYRTAPAPFDWRYTGEIARQREVLLANLGYLGHMWELYAMWVWVPAFLTASFALAGAGKAAASAAAFLVIGAGAAGSLVAGRLADRMGRTAIAIASLAVSGACCLVIGSLFGASPFWVTLVCVIWGFAVVADSAQFSACVTELCHPQYTGTALTLQTSLGFLLTLVTIRLLPAVQSALGWNRAFLLLALGPAAGIWAMARLRAHPAAAKLAGGRK